MRPSPDARRRRVGVIGTFVWDVIYGPPPKAERMEGWGGVAYALSGLDAALPDAWEIVPIMKVGADVAERAMKFLHALQHVSPASELVVVPEPNNRSELRYVSAERRSERLSGGTPGWSWDELEPRLAAARLDALYVNFLSGWEVDLATMQRVRAAFSGPIYVDLHMLMWETQPSGVRDLRPLADAAAWYRCFDIIQVNEDEMAMLAADLPALASAQGAEGVVCTVVTLASRGAAFHAAPSFTMLADMERARLRQELGDAGNSGVVAPDTVRNGPAVDPTGCGDVWGASLLARLLAGDELTQALRAANGAAGRNAGYRGASGLAARLRQPSPTR